MAEIVSFADILRLRRERRARELTRRCREIVELNLRAALALYDECPPHERPFHARRVRVLAELLEALVARE
ncbi:MAG: hypothetical protein KatS3mg076_0839 [Candidatus Binatia bacterium]|nr:MAG: hypothetical protein KatS3mg076_0839 [Candidatus Binatia bacterium]